jgi:hypothetical protein
MAKKKKRTIVGSPLTPVLLAELGALDEFPRMPKDFDPRGDWVNTYRIWTCHGYRESGNYNVGFVRIERVAGGSKEIFALKVHQEVVEVDGLLNAIDANIYCLNNQLASPVRWHLWSRFINSDKQPVGELETEEKVVIKGNVMSVETGEHTLKRKVTGRVTCDWCLFEAVQRLEFDEKSSLDFNMLEGLSLVKKRQRLMYRGVYPMKLSGRELVLHRFDQIGEGILPYEYWLDDNHRLLAAISMHKAYILDEQAEKALRQRTEQLRKSYQRIKTREGRKANE